MGAVSFSLDRRLVQELQKHLPLRVFVEAGTFRGATVEHMAEVFASVYSVELSEDCFRETTARLAHLTNLHLCCGDSPAFLRENCPRLAEQGVLYWLDAHWCVAANTAGERSQCPILDELGAIGALNAQSALLIDDARLYLAPPPAPHEISQWPRFDDVCRELRKLSENHVLTVWNDVIILLPRRAYEQMQGFFVEYGIDWLWAMEQSRTYNQLLEICQEREAEIHRLKAKHDEAVAIAQERHAAVLHIQEELINLSKPTQEKEEEIHRLKAHCDQRLAESQEKEAEIARLKTAFDALVAEATKKETVIQELVKDRDDGWVTIARQKESEIRMLKGACDKLVEAAHAKGREVNELWEQLTGKEAVIQGLQGACKERLELIENLTKVCAERELVIAKLSEMLEQRQKVTAL